MTMMYVVRHGEYVNPDYVFPGRLPGFPLSPNGKKQAGALADFLIDKHVDVLYSSPIQRTRDTAIILSDRLHIPIRFDIRLIEVRTSLDGLSMKRFDETNGELLYFPEYVSKGAESMIELAVRVHTVLEEIRKNHEGQTIVVVTHGDPMRFGIMKYRKVPITFSESRKIDTPLAGGYTLEFDESGQVHVNPIVI